VLQKLGGEGMGVVSVMSRVTLGVAGVLLLGLTVLRAVECWSTDSHLEHVAGVWVAEAIDLTRGLFYRAPYGSYGYGGPRYFPPVLLRARSGH
jgi:hypothetical protein